MQFDPLVNNTLVRYGLPSQPRRIYADALRQIKKMEEREAQERTRRRKRRRSRVREARRAGRKT